MNRSVYPALRFGVAPGPGFMRSSRNFVKDGLETPESGVGIPVDAPEAGQGRRNRDNCARGSTQTIRAGRPECRRIPASQTQCRHRFIGGVIQTGQ